MTDASPLTGPHGRLSLLEPRPQFLAQLFDRLWDRYRSRVHSVTQYEALLARRGATFVNDHIAFRTLACQTPATGIPSVARLFEALGYVAAGCYQFPDKHLSAIHLQPPHPELPKLFVSELQTWRLDDAAQTIIRSTLRTHRPPLSDELLVRLQRVQPADFAELLPIAVDWIETLPWDPPEYNDVQALSRASQYAAWALVHGHNVNHFTALINSHGVAALADIDRTVAALRDAGVPMKAEIEGAPGSKLRQTATEAVTIDVPVRVAGQPAVRPWSYAYFELAERNPIVDPETGASRRFEGFLGAQATHLFEMTRRKD
jgi:hypothetical protein